MMSASKNLITFRMWKLTDTNRKNNKETRRRPLVVRVGFSSVFQRVVTHRISSNNTKVGKQLNIFFVCFLNFSLSVCVASRSIL